MTSITRTSLLAGLACAVALASGCNSDSSSSDSAQATTTAAKKVGVGVKAPGLIAFRRYTDASQAEGAVFTVKPDGTGEKQVTHPPTNYVDDQPAFSADGSKIAFERCPTADPKPCRVWTVNRDGGGEREIPARCPTGPASACDRSGPAWSEDGRLAVNLASGPVKSGDRATRSSTPRSPSSTSSARPSVRSPTWIIGRETSAAPPGRPTTSRSSTSASGPRSRTRSALLSSSSRRRAARRGA